MASASSLAEVSFRQGVKVGYVGFPVGIVAGVIGLLMGSDASEVGAISARFYPALVVGTPAALVAATLPDLQAGGRALYAAGLGKRVLTSLLVVAVVSVAVASGAFIAMALAVPALFTLWRLDPVTIIESLRVGIGWAAPVAALVVSGVAAALEALYLQRRFGSTTG